MTRLIICTLLMVALMILISCTGTGEGASSSTLNISRNGKKVSEQVKVDVKKNLEMYIVREHQSAKKATLVVMYDFNKGLTMIKDVPGSKCFLKNSTDGALRPIALEKELKQVKKNSKIKVSSKTEEVIKELGKLNRQMYSKVLGKEMERLCEGLPIVLVTPGNLNDIKRANDWVQESDEIQEKASASDEGQVEPSCRSRECWYQKRCWNEIKCKKGQFPCAV